MQKTIRASVLAALAAATLSFSFSVPAAAQNLPQSVIVTDSLSHSVADLIEAKRILGGDDAQPDRRDPDDLRHKTVHAIDIALEDIRGAAAQSNIAIRDVAPEHNEMTGDVTVAHGVERLLSRAIRHLRHAGDYGTLRDAAERINAAARFAHRAEDEHVW